MSVNRDETLYFKNYNELNNFDWKKFWDNSQLKTVNIKLENDSHILKIDDKGPNFNELNQFKWQQEFLDVSTHEIVQIKIRGDEFGHKIDKKEFETYKELKGNLEGIDWAKRLKMYYPIKAIKRRKNINKNVGKLEDYILKFIEDTELENDEGEISLPGYPNELKAKFAEKMTIILKYGFEIEFTNDQNWFIITDEVNKVEGIWEKFKVENELYKEYENYKTANKNSRIFHEKHFHICFLLLLDKVVKRYDWEGEKECTRLHTLLNTLLNKENKTSTGYIDVYFKDKNEINIVEVKYIDPDSKESYDKVKIEGIDQVCSYKLEGNIASTNLFLLIFIFNKENKRFECKLESKWKSQDLKTYESKQEEDLSNQISRLNL